MSESAQPLRGAAAIGAALVNMPQAPGVYRMLDRRGNVLYVGKARDLRKRLAAYTQPARLDERLRRMVSETVGVEIVVTHTEAEALLLEANLIKRLKPYFNIVLRDDKSYPWLLLTKDHPFPQITKHRGAQVRKGDYWGPFASAWAVKQSVTAMQRIFLLRSCSDTVFAHRTRPCLLYQIGRCSAPCVGKISEADYGRLVSQAEAFMSGRGAAVQEALAAEMEKAASALNFEQAASLRDRIRGLTHVQGSGVVNPASIGDADVIAAWQAAGQTAIEVFFIRGGHNNGNRAFFPAHVKGAAAGEVIGAFVGQFYDDKPPPPVLLLSHAPPEQVLIGEALTLKAGRKVSVLVPERGEKRAVVVHAETNAREALERKLAEAAGQAKLLAEVAELFHLPEPPSRIEIYDNSHIMGANPYGVMVVAGADGFEKAAYRKFGIRGPVTPGDDYAMLREVFERRFGRLLAERTAGEQPPTPGFVLIDGGAGQLAAASEVLQRLGLAELALTAIAKGPDRNAGREWLYVPGRAPFQLPSTSPVLYFLQRLRDEAHRFAITSHRSGRARGLRQSELDEIAGVGAARKRALLNHFGSARGIKGAGLADLEAAPGVSHEIARRVYAHFHPGAHLPDVP
ncbi:MAG: excinuclease ABC subunit UvrC [Acetobacteraceae bacterium]